MSNPFFDHPILNGPYDTPTSHWELDESGQPTHAIVPSRRRASFISPIPKAKMQKTKAVTGTLKFGDDDGISTEKQEYDPNILINEIRAHVETWRTLHENLWQVTGETATLLKHWRLHDFKGVRPFFCQLEAVETAIWLTEVAPQNVAGKRILSLLDRASKEANPLLSRVALKLATGAGKTTVMAMLIAWQTVNAVRMPGSNKFTKGFLVVSPGITIKDRLRVLQPNDPESYFTKREIVPVEMMDSIRKARIVITNYHAFKLRQRIELSAGGRALLKGRTGDDLETLETEGQMLQRVIPELMSFKRVLVINDEAHHCYREKPGESDEEKLSAEDKEEIEGNKEAARLWVSGIEAVSRKLGTVRVFDLSATPFFLRGSGYAEGTLFPWTASDFSLMDAIECGIVKLPRVPVSQNIPGSDMPMFRDLWEHIRKEMPKKGRRKASDLDPLALPARLQTALQVLYGHYEKTYELWQQAGIDVPPCFIVVCNNTSTSKLVYDYIAGFVRENDDGKSTVENGRLPLFRNYDEHCNPLGVPKTLLIDSEQLESGDALDDRFRAIAGDEIERFRRDIIERSGDQRAGDNILDHELLREVMNTVGKTGRLGAGIRCVVSVSMLTEGWDANTVTHILGVRAFGTQLLCEQVIGRALRRQSYDLNDSGLFDVEYADILGIPFDFNAKPVIVAAQPPRVTIQVNAVRPERDGLEIRFPRVQGYRIDPPTEHLDADFNADSTLILTPETVGPTITQNSGIIGESVQLNLQHLEDIRPSTLLFNLTQRLLITHWRDKGEEPKLYLFGQLKRIVRRWLDEHLICKGSTNPGLLMYQDLADMACNKITAGITMHHLAERPVLALLDPYNSVGSTSHVLFTTSKPLRWQTDSRKCHVNWAILDSEWEGELCRVVEFNDRVYAYVKNQNLGLEVPYRMGSVAKKYIPDYVVLIDDGHGEDDLLHLIVEIKGYRGEDAKEKKLTMDTYWIPGVNNLGTFGRWAFGEFTDLWDIEEGFETTVERELNKLLDTIATAVSVFQASDNETIKV
jgi:type III restriction enzyme